MIAAVVVDYNVGRQLQVAIESLRADGVDEIVVVENGASGSTRAALGALASKVSIVVPGENIGFGAGVNRGVAALRSQPEFVVVANPDTEVHQGAVPALCDSLKGNPSLAIVGPLIMTPDGERYPSIRRFPSAIDAVGHAVIGLVSTNNRFSRRYRSAEPRPGGGVDWVSGAFFAVRRTLFEQIGGFDERYFMFAEDMDLCWRSHRAGFGVEVCDTAVVTHIEGVSRRSHPYRMLVAHHRSALRFAATTTTGSSRLLLPMAAIVLGLRLVGAVVLTLARVRPQT
ncbi:MAG: glycosyltransferase family 2 protein [Actinomycetes bacterium]